VPSDVVAVMSPVRAPRDTTPVLETTAGFELAQVRLTPLADAGNVRFFVTLSSDGLSPRTVDWMSRRMMPSVAAAFSAAVGMLSVTSCGVRATSQNFTSDTSAFTSGSGEYRDRPR
jgi:hypothetical protein